MEHPRTKGEQIKTKQPFVFSAPPSIYELFSSKSKSANHSAKSKSLCKEQIKAQIKAQISANQT